MKAIFEFDLDDPEDEMAMKRCVFSKDMAIALFEIVNNSWRNVRDVEHYQEKINEAMGRLNIDDLIN